jgi:hypothetical protein
MLEPASVHASVKGEPSPKSVETAELFQGVWTLMNRRIACLELCFETTMNIAYELRWPKSASSAPFRRSKPSARNLGHREMGQGSEANALYKYRHGPGK